ncbi:MAG: nitroreductase family deazaflavin-dependent oxidoreductase [Deltaproteobacteria bacterium]|nr:MAG: nitroreductase family deazaflavin-dependent oxidoreductase [Deltaproteobacteria bacterium]
MAHEQRRGADARDARVETVTGGVMAETKPHPWTRRAWYHNLAKHSAAQVQIGSRTRDMVARRASDAEKAALWPRLVAIYPDSDRSRACAGCCSPRRSRSRSCSPSWSRARSPPRSTSSGACATPAC